VEIHGGEGFHAFKRPAEQSGVGDVRAGRVVAEASAVLVEPEAGGVLGECFPTSPEEILGRPVEVARLAAGRRTEERLR
jgi:hypothetical protein